MMRTVFNNIRQFFFLAFLLAGCTFVDFGPPDTIEDACSIVKQNPHWYRSMRKVEARYGVPVSVQMAIIYQESKFVRNARPKRQYRFGVIPAGRPTTAYGYGQAVDGTWKWYQESTGRPRASRTNYDDVVNFIGWYSEISARELGISKRDSRRLYLAYHEGHAGYRKGSYRSKQWLLNVADSVAAQNSRYARQLANCRTRFT